MSKKHPRYFIGPWVSGDTVGELATSLQRVNSELRQAFRQLENDGSMRWLRKHSDPVERDPLLAD